MKVELISVTDDRVSAWRYSRHLPETEEVNLKELEVMPFSLHSLKRYTFKVEMARVMLDLISNFTKCIWSQTSRIIPVADVVLDFNSELAQRRLDHAKELNESGELPQDVIRLETPIFSRIGFCFSMDHRTLMGFLKSMERLVPELFSYYGLAILDAIGMPEYELMESNYGEVVDKSVTKEFFSQTHHNVGIRYTEGIGLDQYNLISQFSRHSDVTILSSLWTMTIEEMSQLVMKDSINYYYNINNAVYNHGILSHRSCWIADWNNWSERVSKVYSEDDIAKIIPCKCDGEQCKYKADLTKRIQGLDPNLPCPIYTKNKEYLTQRIMKEGRSFLSNAYAKILENND